MPKTKEFVESEDDLSSDEAVRTCCEITISGFF